MKRTSFIILTLVASLSISVGSAQSNASSGEYGYLYEPENRDTIKYDTLKRRPTLPVDPNFYTYYDFYFGVPAQPYNYYYQSRFWNSMFRFWAPRRYNRLISRVGFVPNHIRAQRNAFSYFSSGRTSNGRTVNSRVRGEMASQGRGGFGRSGSVRGQFN